MREYENTTACMQHTTVANDKSRYNYLSSGKYKQDSFRKDKLPLPISVLKKLGLTPKPANASGYWAMHCPFHKKGNEKKPSLNLHYIRGNYRCHACGAKGGDILAFYRQVTGKSFIAAAKDLGAWEDKV